MSNGINEVLKCLEYLYNSKMFKYNGDEEHFIEQHNTIKQALTTKSKKEHAFEIIKDKYVSRFQLSCCKHVYEYNDLKFSKTEELTKEEFELLKEVLDNDK